MKNNPISRLLLIFLFSLSLFSTACSKEPDRTPMQLTAYNHTDASVGSYSVSFPDGSRLAAGFLDAGEGGGGFTCCVLVPRNWYAGMTVTVAQRTIQSGAPVEKSTLVPIPQYAPTDATTLNVHFLRSGKIKVFVSKFGIQNRKYPLTGKEAELRPGEPIDYVN